jgi:hypothetical protein
MLMNVLRKSRRGVNAVAQLLQRSRSNGMDAEVPTVFVDFEQPIPIRTMRELLILFSQGGYSIWLRGKFNRWFLHVGEDLTWHDGTYLAWRSPLPASNLTVCTDSTQSLNLPGFRKVIHLHYDYSPKLSLPDGHFAIPLPMHPQLYVEYHEVERLETYRSNRRRLRILFSGNCDEDGYDQPIIKELYRKLSRLEIMKAIQSYGWGRWTSETRLVELLKLNDYQNEFLLLGPEVRINQRNWLKTVSESDFFLCPPGIVFAWSYNLVEAMAVGTIPITNYPEWLFPPLKHGVNALTFSTITELGQALDFARRMSDAQIAQLRKNVIAYYETHLTLKPFVKRLMDHPASVVHLHGWRENEIGAREAYLGHNKPQETQIL